MRTRTALLLPVLAALGCSDPAAVGPETSPGTSEVSTSMLPPAESTGSPDTGSTTTEAPGSTSGTGPTTTGTDATGDLSSGSTTGIVECTAECFTGRCTPTGQCMRRVFVTASAFARVAALLGNADHNCQLHADSAGLEGTYKALLERGLGVGSAFEEIAWDLVPDARFVLADESETLVADSPMQLRVDLDPTAVLDHPINHTARGNPIGASGSTACEDGTVRTWTGMHSPDEQSPVTGGENCGGWNGIGIGGTGRLDEVDRRWLGDANCSCVPSVNGSALAHVYCFEVP